MVLFLYDGNTVFKWANKNSEHLESFYAGDFYIFENIAAMSKRE